MNSLVGMDVFCCWPNGEAKIVRVTSIGETGASVIWNESHAQVDGQGTVCGCDDIVPVEWLYIQSGHYLKERDQLRRDLAAAREELENLQASGIHSCHDKCQRPLCKMRRELDAARDRERKLREALEWYANQGSFVDECGVKVKVECDTTIARSALAATKEGPTTQQEQPL